MGEVACWTVATGNVSIIKRKSRQAARYMAKQEGFLGIYSTGWNGHTMVV